jgi:hypothetical protein
MCFGFFGFSADLPQGCLRAIAIPMTSFAFPDCVPAGFVLPMVMTAADCESWLCPDDLAADFEAAALNCHRSSKNVFI